MDDDRPTICNQKSNPLATSTETRKHSAVTSRDSILLKADKAVDGLVIRGLHEKQADDRFSLQHEDIPVLTNHPSNRKGTQESRTMMVQKREQRNNHCKNITGRRFEKPLTLETTTVKQRKRDNAVKFSKKKKVKLK